MKWWCFGLLVFFLLPSCSRETKEEERVLGYMGKARKNPYLAAERYLQASGKISDSSSGVLRFDDFDDTVFAPASSVRSVGDAERILEWVADGGHFVLFLQRGEDYWRDLGEVTDHNPEFWDTRSETVEEVNHGLDFLLAELDLELAHQTLEVESDSEGDKESSADAGDEVEREQELEIARGNRLPHSQKVSIYLSDSENYDVLLGGSQHLVLGDGEYYEGDWYDVAEQHQFFSRLYGYHELEDAELGRVTLLSDARLFRNPYLGMEQHAEFLDALTHGDEQVVFSLGRVRGFTELLGEHASKAMWALLALVVLWLWKNLPRFGPLLEVAEGHSRNYLEHVQQVGRFFWRQQRADILIRSLQAAVERKSGHAFSEKQERNTLITKLSQNSGLDHTLVEEAMLADQVKDANAMVRIIQTLQTLLK